MPVTVSHYTSTVIDTVARLVLIYRYIPVGLYLDLARSTATRSRIGSCTTREVLLACSRIGLPQRAVLQKTVDNCTFEADAALAIASEMHEMEEGAGMSKRQTMTALQKLGGNKSTDPVRTLKRQGFLKRFLDIIKTLRFW